jgi:AcrR family transcriptional regulator
MTKTEMAPAVREQLLEAMLRELGEKGRKGISLAAVLAAADVSAEEFAAEFTDLDACLDAAYQQLTARFDAAARAGCNADRPPVGAPDWPRRVRGGLEALLAELADDPTRARTLIRSFPALGTKAQARYQAFVEGFAPLLADGREFSGVTELPAGVEMLAVGAAEAILFEEVASGRTEQLPTLAPSILFSVLVPFLGPAAAAAEMGKAQQRS